MHNEKVYNVGICDIHTRENNTTLKSYMTWYDMIRRCYNEVKQITHPTYKKCSVCDEWHTFSNFKNWFDVNYTNGYHLDKDILSHENKIYSPTTCCFIPRELNVLLNTNDKSRGIYPIGVSWRKREKKFIASIKLNGKNKHLGYFDNQTDAHNAWKTSKQKYLVELAESYFTKNMIQNNVKIAIINYANMLG